NFSGFLINTNRKEIVSVLCRRCQPHLAAHDHGGCPTFIWNLRLPLYIVGFAPVQRQTNRLVLAGSGRVAVSPGATELRPLRARCRAKFEPHCRQREGGKCSFHRVHLCRLKWSPGKVNDSPTTTK